MMSEEEVNELVEETLAIVRSKLGDCYGLTDEQIKEILLAAIIQAPLRLQ